MPDGKTGLLINRVLPTYFRKQEYFAGIEQVTNDFIAIVSGDITIDQARNANRGNGSGSGLKFAAIIIGFIIFSNLRNFSRNRRGLSSRGWIGASSWSSGGGGFGGGGGGGGGFSGGGFSGGGAGGGW